MPNSRKLPSSARIALAFLILVFGSTLSYRLLNGPGVSPHSDETVIPVQGVSAKSHPKFAGDSRVGTRPIESLQVGDRVLAHNPEIEDVERSQWQEPDWSDWVRLSLSMPVPTSTGEDVVLNIEMLRPESWVIENAEYVYEERPTVSFALDSQSATQDDLDVNETYLDAVPFSPLRPAFRWFELIGNEFDQRGLDLVGLALELNLPEMGAVGTAVVTDIQACSSVSPGRGQVITATFAHPPATTVLDVYVEGESQPIGVTDNHLFWSPDSETFVPIGEIPVGESLLAHDGTLRRLQAKDVRSGVHLVYNLEVYGEHVYFVGDEGLLAHNKYLTPAIRHSNGHLGTHLNKHGQMVRRTARKGLAGDHVLPKAVIAKALRRAGVKPNSKLYREVIEFQDSSKNLRLMDFSTNSSKKDRMALDWWRNTPIGQKMPRKYIRKMLGKQYKNAQEINEMIAKQRGGPVVDYFADFFGR
ncbi:MAG: polymorphic toxin-type HINT domain-containing protein [Planctomycetota bacterium]